MDFTNTNTKPPAMDKLATMDEGYFQTHQMCIKTTNETITDDRVYGTTTTLESNTTTAVFPADDTKEPASPMVKQLSNFGVIEPGLYRSGYPQTEHYPFLKSLNIKTIVTLVSKELPEGYQAFIDENGITHRIFDMAGTKKQAISLDMMQEILEVVTNSDNYPLLIHCNHGKHRTGCVAGLVRKASQWGPSAIVQEYTRFASPKARETDIEYLTKFDHLHLENARRRLILKSTSMTKMTVSTYTRPNPQRFTVGGFLFFLIVASITLCIFVFTGRTLSRPPPPRRRDTGS